MDFETGFTPGDASLSFVFMRRAFECGEAALFQWRDQSADQIIEVVGEASRQRNPALRLDEKKMWEKRNDEYRVLEIENMLRWHRHSYFLMAFSLCESSVTNFAARLLDKFNSPFRTRHLSGTGLERVKTIAKVFDIAPNPFDGDRWREVERMRDVRNKLAHAGGLLEDESSISKMRQTLCNWEGASLVNYGSPVVKSIELQDYFVRHAISSLSEFTDEIAKAFFKNGEQTC